MKNTIMTTAIAGLATILLTACENPASGGPITCNMPCVNSAPTSDTSSFSLSTGATVTISYTLEGNLANVLSTRADIIGVPVSTSIAGLGTATSSPSTVDITSIVSVSAGATSATTGNHYPMISMFDTSGNGSILTIDPTKSTTHYTYIETISGVQQAGQLTNYPVPIINITP